MTYHMWLFIIDAILLALMSFISFITFCHDKKLAIKQKPRVKEKVLLGMTVLNGAIGSFLGRLFAHHKTDKIYFSITIYFALLCQACVLVFLALFAFVL